MSPRLLFLAFVFNMYLYIPYPDSKVHGANMGPIGDRQDPGGPHVCHMNFAIWDTLNYPAWIM